ncbi:MAG: branched-chain amino acid ABC transporter permease [Anaerolineae bacterium]|uniref:branched-chain amino acid ABC transporter permease n=1 Tax=Candidatus Flexifilum breve TaxID=3140694 RepID=UPI001AD0EC63|nr:branched-chain amino acid ABC transporter permease [Chloroflexota bacterium]MBK9751633.1 branched-chain amino acid ABC transporter permease [Chloroflexota bacterium]MBN8637271.1 branched-chain amino acid ABC transporter permease [Anaerolineae bacterium]
MNKTYWLIAVVAVALLLFGFVNANGDLGSFGITIMSGLFQAMLLFLVASGLSIVFGLMDVLNFAQGSFFMIGAYVGYAVHHSPQLISVLPNGDVRFVVSLLAAVLVGGVLGVFFERALLRPLYARPIFQIVLTFGVALVIGELIKVVWTPTPYSWTAMFTARSGFFTVFEQQFSTYRLFVIGAGFLLIIGIGLLLQRTRIGIIIRAGVEDSQMVEALGINVRAVFTLVFTLGCAVAALGGAVAAPFLGASTGLANQFLLSAIAIVVLGGLGSYGGTAIASILVGVAVAVIQDWSASPGVNAPVWASLTPMLLLVLILLIRPSGLFGKEN